MRSLSTQKHNENFSEESKDEKTYRIIFDRNPLATCMISLLGSFLQVNDKFCSLVGSQREDLLQTTLNDVLQIDFKVIQTQAGEQLYNGLVKEVKLEHRLVCKNGDALWLNLFLSLWTDASNQPAGYIITLVDIKTQKEFEEKLQKSDVSHKTLLQEIVNKQAMMLSLFDSIPEIIPYKGTNGAFIGCNKAFEALTGLKEENLVGRTDYDIMEHERADEYRKVEQQMLMTKQPVRLEEIIINSLGEKFPVETLKFPYYNADGSIIGAICMSRDISERKQEEEKIFYLTYHDILTGVHNRTYFELAVRRLEGEENLPLSIIFGDLNGLKLINDTFGHVTGDNLLINTAKILKSFTQEQDILARTGGDEFCILLPKTSNKDAENVMEKIKKAIDDENQNNPYAYQVGISLGCATRESSQQSFVAAVKVAEDSMYRKKLLENSSFHSSILTTIKTTLAERSNETEEHASRLKYLANELGRVMELTNDEMNQLELLCALHDVGKVGISDSVLKKPGPLNQEEWLEMKKHSEIGARIARAFPELQTISEYILCHHEQWDGTGYPEGISGEAIPLLSRILSVIDGYDAMTNDRVYRKAISKNAAIKEIKLHAGTQFDPVIAKRFIEEVLEMPGH
jgi:diguanylate cyclase (GGDEF)-like protein/PAS domain S-box-containing protein